MLDVDYTQTIINNYNSGIGRVTTVSFPMWINLLEIKRRYENLRF